MRPREVIAIGAVALAGISYASLKTIEAVNNIGRAVSGEVAKSLVIDQAIDQMIEDIKERQECAPDVFELKEDVCEPEPQKISEPDCKIKMLNYDPSTGQGIAEIHCTG